MTYPHPLQPLRTFGGISCPHRPSAGKSPCAHPHGRGASLVSLSLINLFLMSPLSRRLAILSLTGLSSLLGDTAPPAAAPPLWLMIGDASMRDAARPLAEYRQSEGFEIIGLAPPSGEALDALPRSPDFIVLLGDDLLSEPPEHAVLRGERHELYRWRASQPDRYVSDAVLGDRDGDGVPEVPVGRLPGRDPMAIAALSAKIVAFEKQPMSREALHLPVWAGNPAYGSHFHANMASNLLRQTLHGDAPLWADLTLLIGNATDPLSAHPDAQHEWFHDMLEKGGGLFTGLMGHGGTDAFYSMPHEGRWIRYHASQTAQLQGRAPSAPALIFACDCGNFAHPQLSLAESLILAPNGPVAVIAATTQSHPLPNYYSSVCWLRGLTKGSPRLGERWMRAQQCGYEMRNPLVELFLKDIEGKLEAKLDTAQIRRDHLRLYALLGDPATHLKRPQLLEVQLEREGDQWNWSIPHPPSDAQRLEIGHREPPPPLVPKDTALSREEALESFHEANALLRYRPLASHPSPKAEAWSGRLPHRRGSLRWVVETPGALYVAAHPLVDP